jgi:hypothetical protein
VFAKQIEERRQLRTKVAEHEALTPSVIQRDILKEERTRTGQLKTFEEKEKIKKKHKIADLVTLQQGDDTSTRQTFRKDDPALDEALREGFTEISLSTSDKLLQRIELAAMNAGIDPSRLRSGTDNPLSQQESIEVRNALKELSATDSLAESLLKILGTSQTAQPPVQGQSQTDEQRRQELLGKTR